MNNINSNNIFLEKLIDKFCKIYKIEKNIIKTNDKIRFRFECFKYKYMMKHIDLPDIIQNSTLEAVLIEYRIFPHIEFLIRNTILKLGNKWSYTVICGNLNYDFVKNICSQISKNIKVIKTNYDNLSQNDYSLFLSSLDFWNLLVGSKILIYQEDSFIFKSNIDEFIGWDYIGAPWPKNTNDTPNCVGNGGLSLRTKQIMIDVINKISIPNTSINTSTKIYMTKNNLTYCPEDVYFSLNMQKYNIGKVADFESAFKFSSESLYNINSFGGHNFWISDLNWLNRLQKNMKLFNYTSNNNDLNEYLYFFKKPLQFNLTETKQNAFDIDFEFYKKCNNIFIKNNNELSIHFNNYGMNGLIYNPKQIYNLYPNINIFHFLNEILILKNNKTYLLNNFIDEYLYSKSFDYFMDLTIYNFYDNLSQSYSPLILLVFIGNIQVGNDLLERIINYKNIEKFNISFCFNSKNVYHHFKDIIKTKFIYFSIYFTHEYGTDIQPTIFMYNNISKKYNFEYIIKLHTKTIKNEYNNLTTFLLSNNLVTLKKKLQSNICNCVGEDNYYLSIDDDTFNKKLIQKYDKFLDIRKKFIRGTIFFSEHIIFTKVINFIKNNDYKSFIFNNLYENNTINFDNSPTHFLERLFGIIK
jgi:hypothetical protein